MASFMSDLRQDVRSIGTEKPVVIKKRELHPGAEDLLKRLRKGQTWLVDVWRHMGLEPVDAREEERFAEGIGLWDDLDEALRNLYDFEGCPIAEGKCNREAPVVCRACADRAVDGLGQQGRLVE